MVIDSNRRRIQNHKGMRHRIMQANVVNEVNTTRVVQHIWLSDGTTRVDVAKELGLVKSTVSRIVSLLLEQGIVRETEAQHEHSRLGRKPVGLEINESYGLVLGLEIQPDFYNAAAIDLRGDVLNTWSAPLSMVGKDPVAAFFEIVEQLEPWIADRGVPLLGIGVAAPGLVDQFHGRILQSNPLNITSPVDFVERVSKRISVPVILENDANCGSWGELVHRKTSRHGNFVFVLGEFRTGEAENSRYWGIAVGLGFVLGGEIYHGASYSAGEFQSILWRRGNEGQFSISDEEARRIKEDRAIMEKALYELSAHVALFVNTLNLTSVVFGGELTEHAHVLKPLMEAEIQKNWSYPSTVECSIDFSPLGKDAVAYGAAGMFLESMFSVPALYSQIGKTFRSRVSVLGTS